MRSPERFVGGIDVCCEDRCINWNLVKTNSTLFAMVKATEGVSGDEAPCLLDPDFEDNVEAAYFAGLRVGAYHCLCAESIDEAREQTEVFLRQIRSMEYMINFYCGVVVTEWENVFDADLYIDIFCGLVTSAGYRPIVYAPPEFIDELCRMEYDLWTPYGDGDFDSLPLSVQKHTVLWQHEAVKNRGIDGMVFRSALVRPEVLFNTDFNSIPVKYNNKKKKDEKKLEANEWAMRVGILQPPDGVLNMEETIGREEFMVYLRRFSDLWRGAYDTVY